MDLDPAAEAFHVEATALHQRRLVDLLRREPVVISTEILVSAYDLISWSYRLFVDIRGHEETVKAEPEEPERDRIAHIALGARWVRNEIVHGRGLQLQPLRSAALDDRSDSKDILFDDPEVTFNGELTHATLRFANVNGSVKDHQPKLRPYFDACLTGRRVVVVAGLLAGQRTLGADWV
jgi:hypothetical protein